MAADLQPIAPPNVSVPATPSTNAAARSVVQEDIHDIKPPVPIPDWSWLGWVLAALVLAALAFGWWRRRRTQTPQQQSTLSPEDLIPPHVRAKRRLEEALQWLDQPQPFVFAVSDALRQYLEEQFDLHAPERTTEEFLEEVQSSPLLDAGQKALLADFLTRCDLVKFARYRPPEQELRELHAAALRLVIETEAARSPSAGAGVPTAAGPDPLEPEPEARET